MKFGSLVCVGTGVAKVKSVRDFFGFYTPIAGGSEMDVYEETRNNVAVHSVYGKMMSSHEVTILREHLTNLAMRGYCRVVIDFTGARWFGSALLGVLVSAKRAFMHGGGNLLIAGLNDRCRRILQTVHLDPVFKCWESVELAVSSFGPLEFKVDIDGNISSFKARRIGARATC